MPMDLNFKPFSGVGILTLYGRDPVTGLINTGGYDLGEPGAVEVTNNAPRVEMNTQRSPDRGVAFSWAGSKAASLSIRLRTVSDYIWTLLTGGVYTDVPAGSPVVNWTFPSGLQVGQVVKFPAMNIGSVTVRDSTGSPVTAVAGTHYEMDLVAGTAKILSLTGLTQPLKADYTPGAVKIIGALKAPDVDYTAVFNGTNSVDNSRVIGEFYRFRFAAEGGLALIQTEAGEYQLNGSLQKDETRLASSTGGQYYRLVQPAA